MAQPKVVFKTENAVSDGNTLERDNESRPGGNRALQPTGMAPPSAAGAALPLCLHRPAERRLRQAPDGVGPPSVRGSLRLRGIAVLHRLCDIRDTELPGAQPVWRTGMACATDAELGRRHGPPRFHIVQGDVLRSPLPAWRRGSRFLSRRRVLHSRMVS